MRAPAALLDGAAGAILDSRMTTEIDPSSETPPRVVEQLLRSHARFLAFLEPRVESRAVAEDILQEAFARALTRGDSLRSDESASAWFYRMLRNALIDHYRHRGAERRALDAAELEPERPNAETDTALMNTVCACMHDLLDTLKPEYADALRQVDLCEQSLADYARQTGITPNNASVRLHRAREALHKRLITSCGTCTAHGCLDCHCQRSGGT
jgi:RNA polymerase sigma-70 factor (ECF subfamily)